uniref:Uncharacterized protein n=1 Tax=Opuntia streptacantha TaxID=393608 RepID=A0A7C9B0H6_OPUST
MVPFPSEESTFSRSHNTCLSPIIHFAFILRFTTWIHLWVCMYLWNLLQSPLSLLGGLQKLQFLYTFSELLFAPFFASSIPKMTKPDYLCFQPIGNSDFLQFPCFFQNITHCHPADQSTFYALSQSLAFILSKFLI